jgi:adenylate kinase
MKAIRIAGPTVLHLDVPDSILTRRLSTRRQCASCGAVYNLSSIPSTNGSRCELDGGALVERDDDVEGVVARRLAAYEAETLPVIDYYRTRNRRAGTYRRLDGTLDPSVIAKGVGAIVLAPETALAA